MKNFFLILVILPFICFSQNQGVNDLYLFVDGDSQSRKITNHNSKADFEIYYLSLTEKKDSVTNDLSIRGTTKPIIKFTYLNKNDNNLPFVIRENKIKDFLSYPEDFHLDKLKSLLKLLNRVSNIYMIESKYCKDQTFFMVKKVNYDLLPGL